MSERLIIRLGELADNPIPWLLLDRDGKVQEQGQLTGAEALSELTVPARGRQVIVLVASTAVALHQVEIPPGGRRNLRQALPFLLEEELATDVEGLHFALGASDDDNRQAVAVVSHDQMASWKAWLEAAQLSTRFLVPELLCLALPEDAQWQAHTLQGVCLIRQGVWQGAAVETDWLPAWLSAQPAPDAIQCSSPALVHSLQAQGQKAEPDREALPAELAGLAAGLPPVPFTLLQGAYKAGQGLGKNWRLWRRVAVLGALALSAQLAMGYVELSSLKRQQAEYKSASEAIYRDLFGSDARIVNLRAQMRQKVEALDTAELSPDFLDMLTALEPILRQDGKLTLTGLKYDDRRSELKLNAQADDFAGFEQFAARLEQASLAVEQGALRRDRQGLINGEVTVREVR